MIPYKPAEDLWSALVPVVAMLLVLAAVAGFALWYARRRGVALLPLPGRSRSLRVVERLALSRRALLLVIEYEGQRYLIGQSGDQLSLLARGAAAPPSGHEPG